MQIASMERVSQKERPGQRPCGVCGLLRINKEVSRAGAGRGQLAKPVRLGHGGGREGLA